MPAAGPPASARSAAPLPAGAGAARPLVAGQERHLDRSGHGKRRLSRRLSSGRSGSGCGRRGTATAWAGLEAGAGLVRHSEGAVRQRRAPRAWGSGPRVARCEGAWLEWGRSLWDPGRAEAGLKSCSWACRVGVQSCCPLSRAGNKSGAEDPGREGSRGRTLGEGRIRRRG